MQLIILQAVRYSFIHIKKFVKKTKKNSASNEKISYKNRHNKIFKIWSCSRNIFKTYMDKCCPVFSHSQHDIQASECEVHVDINKFPDIYFTCLQNHTSFQPFKKMIFKISSTG